VGTYLYRRFPTFRSLGIERIRVMASQNLFVAASGEKGENLVGSVEDHGFELSRVYQECEEQESLIGLRFVALIIFDSA